MEGGETGTVWNRHRNYVGITGEEVRGWVAFWNITAEPLKLSQRLDFDRNHLEYDTFFLSQSSGTGASEGWWRKVGTTQQTRTHKEGQRTEKHLYFRQDHSDFY